MYCDVCDVRGGRIEKNVTYPQVNFFFIIFKTAFHKRSTFDIGGGGRARVIVRELRGKFSHQIRG